MLREIGLAAVILIVLTIVVVLVAVNQTANVGYLGSGVTDDVALSWGQNAELAGEAADEEGGNEAEDTEAEATDEATEESGE